MDNQKKIEVIDSVIFELSVKINSLEHLVKKTKSDMEEIESMIEGMQKELDHKDNKLDEYRSLIFNLSDDLFGLQEQKHEIEEGLDANNFLYKQSNN